MRIIIIQTIIISYIHTHVNHTPKEQANISTIVRNFLAKSKIDDFIQMKNNNTSRLSMVLWLWQRGNEAHWSVIIFRMICTSVYILWLSLCE